MTDEILNVTIEGLGQHHRTSIFPCGIFQYKKGVNDTKGTPNYHLFRKAIKSTSKRIYPNYANCDWSVQENAKQFDIRCRYEVLNTLTGNEEDLLIDHIKADPTYAAEHFRLAYGTDCGIIVLEEELPCELMGTMGKRNTTAHVKSGELRSEVCAA